MSQSVRGGWKGQMIYGAAGTALDIEGKAAVSPLLTLVSDTVSAKPLLLVGRVQQSYLRFVHEVIPECSASGLEDLLAGHARVEIATVGWPEQASAGIGSVVGAKVRHVVLEHFEQQLGRELGSGCDLGKML